MGKHGGMGDETRRCDETKHEEHSEQECVNGKGEWGGGEQREEGRCQQVDIDARCVDRVKMVTDAYGNCGRGLHIAMLQMKYHRMSASPSVRLSWVTGRAVLRRMSDPVYTRAGRAKTDDRSLLGQSVLEARRNGDEWLGNACGKGEGIAQTLSERW